MWCERMTIFLNRENEDKRGEALGPVLQRVADILVSRASRGEQFLQDMCVCVCVCVCVNGR